MDFLKRSKMLDYIQELFKISYSRLRAEFDVVGLHPCKFRYKFEFEALFSHLVTIAKNILTIRHGSKHNWVFRSSRDAAALANTVFFTLSLKCYIFVGLQLNAQVWVCAGRNGLKGSLFPWLDGAIKDFMMKNSHSFVRNEASLLFYP